MVPRAVHRISEALLTTVDEEYSVVCENVDKTPSCTTQQEGSPLLTFIKI
jgi:hypothetical protein